jgi:hypothetical protein
MVLLRLVPETGVRQSFGQQKRIAKFVADAFFQRTHE